jgi:hypothetical protein
LQIRVDRFDSGTRLHIKSDTERISPVDALRAFTGGFKIQEFSHALLLQLTCLRRCFQDFLAAKIGPELHTPLHVIVSAQRLCASLLVFAVFMTPENDRASNSYD